MIRKILNYTICDTFTLNFILWHEKLQTILLMTHLTHNTLAYVFFLFLLAVDVGEGYPHRRRKGKEKKSKWQKQYWLWKYLRSFSLRMLIARGRNNTLWKIGPRFIAASRDRGEDVTLLRYRRSSILLLDILREKILIDRKRYRRIDTREITLRRLIQLRNMFRKIKRELFLFWYDGRVPSLCEREIICDYPVKILEIPSLNFFFKFIYLPN